MPPSVLQAHDRRQCPATVSGPPRRLPPATWRVVVALAGVALGLAGADLWIYVHVSCPLSTPERPLDHDFYTVTRPFWGLLRYSLGYVFLPLALFVAGFVLHPARRRRYGVGLAAVLTAALAANLLQEAIGRQRPVQAGPDRHLAFVGPFARFRSIHAGASFPSGEAATAFACVYVLTRVQARGRRVLYLFAVLTAAARLVNGAHYLSDVIAGALLGLGFAAMVWRWGLRRFDTPAAGA